MKAGPSRPTTRNDVNAASPFLLKTDLAEHIAVTSMGAGGRDGPAFNVDSTKDSIQRSSVGIVSNSQEGVHSRGYTLESDIDNAAAGTAATGNTDSSQWAVQGGLPVGFEKLGGNVHVQVPQATG